MGEQRLAENPPAVIRLIKPRAVMGSSSPPFGLRTVTPYLVVEDVARLITFLSRVFGAVSRGEPNVRDDGSIQHAEVKIGDSVIMMGEPNNEFTSMPSMIYLYVADCDESYQKALAAGAVSVLEPALYPHGDRYGGVRDFAGNIWWIVTHIGIDTHDV